MPRKPKPPGKNGRPAAYSPQIATDILVRIMGGESLRKICTDETLPARSTVHLWIANNEGAQADADGHPVPGTGFSDQYARACELRADDIFDQMLEIADTPLEGEKTKVIAGDDGSNKTETMTADMIEHRRLQIDARKWILARMIPRKYGDKVQNEVSGPNGEPVFFKTVYETK